MKILIKQTDILRGQSKLFKEEKVVGEYFVYLMDATNRPLSCEIVYGKAAKNDLVNQLLVEHFLPTDWENNKNTFNTSSIVEEVSFEEYMELAKDEE